MRAPAHSAQPRRRRSRYWAASASPPLRCSTLSTPCASFCARAPSRCAPSAHSSLSMATCGTRHSLVPSCGTRWTPPSSTAPTSASRGATRVAWRTAAAACRFTTTAWRRTARAAAVVLSRNGHWATTCTTSRARLASHWTSTSSTPLSWKPTCTTCDTTRSVSTATSWRTFATSSPPSGAPASVRASRPAAATCSALWWRPRTWCSHPSLRLLNFREPNPESLAVE
mmetsp:Transcript_39264/g.98671  ORF Transcript_39264/g.98671 Transcript_39264/m.98671 type:complete len:227 (-) Transcript_39264:179-859(-)